MPFQKMVEMPWDFTRGMYLMDRGEDEEWMAKVG